MTGGKYYRADNAEKFQAIYAEIDKLEKTEADVRKFAHHQELFGVAHFARARLAPVGSLVATHFVSEVA